MLKQRLITALILAIIIISSLVFLPFAAFAMLLLGVWLVAAWEWSDLSGFTSIQRGIYVGVVALLLAITLWICQIFNTIDIRAITHLMIVALGWWMLALALVIYYPKSVSLWGLPWQRALMGFFVLIPSAVALLYLLALENGKWIFIYTVFIVVSADVGAYFVGRKWGQKKLIPAVSPGKSWAGFYGGVAACVALVLIASAFGTIANLSIAALLLATVLAGLISVLGDLLESMIKRQRGIKDSSQLLPGHGGFMDRIDSVTAAAPVFVLLLVWLG